MTPVARGCQKPVDDRTARSATRGGFDAALEPKLLLTFLEGALRDAKHRRAMGQSLQAIEEIKDSGEAFRRS